MVAVAVFAQEGIAGLSTRRIAADAGISLSTLQHYFGNRDNLLVITINALLEKYIADYTAISRNAEMTPRQRLELVIDDLLEAVDDPVICGFYSHLWAAAAQDPTIKTLVRESYTRYYETLTTIVSSLRPDLPQERAAALGLSIGAQIDGLLVARLIAPHGLPEWKTVTVNSKAAWFAAIDSALAHK